MIHILAGGKKQKGEYYWLIEDYQKKCRAPYDFDFTFYEEDKLTKLLEKWPFPEDAFVIVADERGEELYSPEFAKLLQDEFTASRKVYIVIGGPFGVSSEARERANFVWSFSKLVFPHMIARLIVSEQIYRANEIARGSGYHHA